MTVISVDYQLNKFYLLRGIILSNNKHLRLFNMSESRNKFTCPKCWKSMVIIGHDKASWNYDETSGEYIQRYYVTCPCAKKVLCKTNTMEPDSDGRGTHAIRVSTQVLDQMPLFTDEQPSKQTSKQTSKQHTTVNT